MLSFIEPCFIRLLELVLHREDSYLLGGTCKKFKTKQCDTNPALLCLAHLPRVPSCCCCSTRAELRRSSRYQSSKWIILALQGLKGCFLVELGIQHTHCSSGKDVILFLVVIYVVALCSSNFLLVVRKFLSNRRHYLSLLNQSEM